MLNPIAGQVYAFTYWSTGDTEPDLAAHRGQLVTVTRAITEPDDKHDAEVLPMFGVRFTDGYEAEVWADELGEI